MKDNIIRFQKSDGHRHIKINNIKILDEFIQLYLPIESDGEYSKLYPPEDCADMITFRVVAMLMLQREKMSSDSSFLAARSTTN